MNHGLSALELNARNNTHHDPRSRLIIQIHTGQRASHPGFPSIMKRAKSRRRSVAAACCTYTLHMEYGVTTDEMIKNPLNWDSRELPCRFLHISCPTQESGLKMCGVQ